MRMQRLPAFKVNLYPRDPEHPELARLELSMARGAFNGVSGFARLGGLTNGRFFDDGRLQFVFRTRRQRRRFMRAIRSRLRHVIVRCVRSRRVRR